MFIKERKVTVNGQRIKAKVNDVYLMFNKPPGVTYTAASHIEGNIIDFVNYPVQILPVDWLDKQSEGLILLTNDGSLVDELLREESKREKDYVVTVDKKTIAFIEEMACGVEINNPRKKGNTITKPCRVVLLTDNCFNITLSQGLNRQIRRMYRRFQYTVTRLQRVRIKELPLGTLAFGQWRKLSGEEIVGVK
ncbi:pseudouridine synthase [Sporosarcina sp. ANT_H38]|uniref:pseudouridine synthase n=1 Tax=Sporosarcina sp. ANT_H38 TaxID=2597358 RepID=UPI003981FE4D